MNTSFSGETLLYSGSAESFAISGRLGGTYVNQRCGLTRLVA
jgi:hypothetical protein